MTEASQEVKADDISNLFCGQAGDSAVGRVEGVPDTGVKGMVVATLPLLVGSVPSTP
jgi:hypothetical protein